MISVSKVQIKTEMVYNEESKRKFNEINNKFEEKCFFQIQIWKLRNNKISKRQMNTRIHKNNSFSVSLKKTKLLNVSTHIES